MNEKSVDHIRGERKVRGSINRPSANIEKSSEIHGLYGQERNARVAEAMAYVMKPTIDRVVRDLNKDPNELALLTVNGVTGLNTAPGVVNENGTETSYRSMVDDVYGAYDQAGKVQEEYYDRIHDAARALKETQDNI